MFNLWGFLHNFFFLGNIDNYCSKCHAMVEMCTCTCNIGFLPYFGMNMYMHLRRCMYCISYSEKVEKQFYIDNFIDT